MGLAGAVDRTGQAAAANFGDAGGGIDLDTVDVAHVDDNASVAERPAGSGMAAASHRQW